MRSIRSEMWIASTAKHLELRKIRRNRMEFIPGRIEGKNRCGKKIDQVHSSEHCIRPIGWRH